MHLPHFRPPSTITRHIMPVVTASVAVLALATSWWIYTWAHQAPSPDAFQQTSVLRADEIKEVLKDIEFQRTVTPPLPSTVNPFTGPAVDTTGTP